MVVRFTFPGYPIERNDLTIRYINVGRFVFDDFLVGNAIGPTPLGRWVVDEVVPTESGIRHRIEFEDGSVVIECSDLLASWR